MISLIHTSSFSITVILKPNKSFLFLLPTSGPSSPRCSFTMASSRSGLRFGYNIPDRYRFCFIIFVSKAFMGEEDPLLSWNCWSCFLYIAILFLRNSWENTEIEFAQHETRSSSTELELLELFSLYCSTVFKEFMSLINNICKLLCLQSATSTLESVILQQRQPLQCVEGILWTASPINKRIVQISLSIKLILPSIIIDFIPRINKRTVRCLK